MCMYAPPWGDVLLVCFDRRHQVALFPPGPSETGRSWALPAVQRRPAEPYRRAAQRLACAMAPPGGIRLGAVTGRIRPTAPGTWPRRRQGERRIFTAHLTARGAVHDTAVALVWLPYARVAERVGGVGAADLDLFLKGYVGGWIPDGWITLEWHVGQEV
ncbi:hypothetical protein HUT19_15635 [Streptomyces sp. NA02950]|uniref:hypothetical protein n=1 Tax=Streptomyces sp. NA02950 TaxID=2742137 RepID=UPI00158FCDA6|nr:hypothetical protein [Streptomyces sp. NA02950]QKV93010.1 hypothetical protein HUT19_15635 [Streptomyces sp. NA02950]